MTKEERYAIWNRYYQRHKTEINSRRKIVRENYKNKLSKTENKIVELEGQVTRAFEVLEGKRKQIEELEQENVELKEQLQKKINITTVSDYPYSALKLEEAKDIIKGFIDAEYGSVQYYDLLNKAEAFLKEISK